MDENIEHGTQIELVVDIVSAYISNNPVPSAEVPVLIQTVHEALQSASAVHHDQSSEVQKPAVPIKKSITPDFLICLEDGRKFRTLKRHLYSKYNLTPDEYRQKWGLPSDYPMVAPNYSAARSELAKATGLGEKRRKNLAGGQARRRGRPRKSA